MSTATDVLQGLRTAIADIATAASGAASTAPAGTRRDHRIGAGRRGGKGFAVVAGEVEDLAAETARATERIRRVVEAVRGEVTAAAAAVAGVQRIIGGVVDAQGTLAAAVEEQSAATGQAEQAMSGATAEAARMAADLQCIVSEA